jgi:hypothetical protein
MKVLSQDANELVAVDKEIVSLIVGPLFIVIGLGIGIGVHQAVALVFAAVFALVGVVVVLLRKVRTIDINKGTGQLTVTVKSILKTVSKPYPVTDIQKVQFLSEYRTNFNPGTNGTEGGTSTSQTTKVLLITKSGDTIDLADGQRSMSSFGVFGHAPNQETGQQIATFLSVPFEQVGPPSLGQVANTIVDAFKGNTGAPSVVAESPTAPASAEPAVAATPPAPPADTVPPSASPPEDPANTQAN